MRAHVHRSQRAPDAGVPVDTICRRRGSPVVYVGSLRRRRGRRPRDGDRDDELHVAGARTMVQDAHRGTRARYCRLRVPSESILVAGAARRDARRASGRLLRLKVESSDQPGRQCSRPSSKLTDKATTTSRITVAGAVAAGRRAARDAARGGEHAGSPSNRRALAQVTFAQAVDLSGGAVGSRSWWCRR